MHIEYPPTRAISSGIRPVFCYVGAFLSYFAPGNVTINRSELLASFFNAGVD